MNRVHGYLIWILLAAVIGVSFTAAATSPLLAWRDPIYIAAGFAGVIGMGLLLVQPLLAAGYLPGLPTQRGRRIHRLAGTALVTSIVVHVAALWITSPPDVVDALLFSSPTPFSAWGVIAMWAAFSAALLAVLRRRAKLRWRTWRLGHTTLAAVTVVGTVVHALLIEGTMETASKITLCALVLIATVLAFRRLRVWAAPRPSRLSRSNDEESNTGNG